MNIVPYRGSPDITFRKILIDVFNVVIVFIWQYSVEKRGLSSHSLDLGMVMVEQSCVCLRRLELLYVCVQVLQATVSDASKIDNNCYRWDLTIQGKVRTDSASTE